MLESHLNTSPATELESLSSPLRMRRKLKGYTVMALTSWSYRGKSGRECSAAGWTLTFKQVCWVRRGRPSGPLSLVHFQRGLLTDLSLSSLWVFASARRATCQVSGLNSNFTAVRIYESRCIPVCHLTEQGRNQVKTSSASPSPLTVTCSTRSDAVLTVLINPPVLSSYGPEREE